jgi:hypothetical protein
MKFSAQLFYCLFFYVIWHSLNATEANEQSPDKISSHKRRILTHTTIEHVKRTVFAISEDEAAIERLKKQSAEKAMAAYLDVCDLIAANPSKELEMLKAKISSYLQKLGYNPVSPNSTYAEVNNQWKSVIYRHCLCRRVSNFFDWLKLIPAEKLDAIDQYFEDIKFRSSL